MKGVELTDRQQLALSIIRRNLKERGVPPTKAELAAEMGLAHPTSVDKHLIALEKKGWADLSRATSRGIRLLREGAPVWELDELPEVRAGTPILAEERAETPRINDLDSITEQFEAKPDYFLRVRGGSLDKVGFRTGDIVGVRCNADVRNKDLIIARIGDEITIKRYHRVDDDTIELEPVSSNDEHETMRIGPATADFEIVGTVVGAIIGTR